MAEPKSVGVRELKANPGKVLRMVRDSNMSVDVTIHGEIVARIVPARKKPNVEEIEAAWRRHEEIGRMISEKWPVGLSAVEAIKEDRREL
jgi:prevent-host-death family protein